MKANQELEKSATPRLKIFFSIKETKNYIKPAGQDLVNYIVQFI